MILQNIKRRCIEKNITIAELERKAGVGNGVVARWATMRPRVDLLKKVADFLGCTVDDLLKEEEA